jgi:predicted O-methyltransferase YrrM
MAKICPRIHKSDPYSGFNFEDYPEDTQGWGSTDPIFKTLVEGMRPKLILEVGSWKGGSAIGMGKMCKEMGLDAEIICIDTWLGSPGLYTREADPYYASLNHRFGYPSLYYTFLTNVVRAGLQDIITPFPLTSHLAADVLAKFGAKADIVYIDAAHDYDSVKLDLAKFWPLLSDEGVLLGDDYKWAGVTAAANEFAGVVKRPIYVAAPNKYVIPKGKRPRFRTRVSVRPLQEPVGEQA